MLNLNGIVQPTTNIRSNGTTMKDNQWNNDMDLDQDDNNEFESNDELEQRDDIKPDRPNPPPHARTLKSRVFIDMKNASNSIRKSWWKARNFNEKIQLRPPCLARRMFCKCFILTE